eukprot:6200471-Pleurochrysis_carterae.AAC.1
MQGQAVGFNVTAVVSNDLPQTVSTNVASNQAASQHRATQSGGFNLLISNIPPDMTVGDLRSFFSDLIESGAFDVFHYLHRADVLIEPVERSNRLDQYLQREAAREATRYGREDSPPIPMVCSSAVRVRTDAFARELVDMYDGVQWVEGRPTRCRIRVIPGAPAAAAASFASDSAMLAAPALQSPTSVRSFQTRAQRRQQLTSG